MLFRCILLLSGFFCLFLPIYANDNLPTINISDFTYKGTNIKIGNTIPDLVKEQFVLQGMFEIIEKNDDAEFILSYSIEEKKEELIFSMEITDITGNKIREKVVKKTHTENDIYIILQEAVEYIHRKVFPFETFNSKDGRFFTAKTMKDFYDDDVVDRNRETVRNEMPSLFDPLNQKLFKKHRWQFFPSCEFSFPFLINDDNVHQAPFVHFPCYMYLFTTEYFMLALLVEGIYVPLRKQVSIDKQNTLDVLGYGGGVGICFPLPLYRQIGFHLNVSGGCAISFLTSDLYTNSLLQSFDPYLHSVFEVEHTITRNISFSIKCSYLLVLYVNKNYLHLLQTGIGLGFRL